MFDPSTLLSRLHTLHCTDQIVVAYSGGLDSSVLLDALARLRDGQQIAALRAVHVNHGLSPAAQEWQSHCETVCGRLGVPLQIEQVEVISGSRGLEHAAREARYAAISMHLHPGDNLLTAQHLDDQAETVLLRLLRGAGPRGMGAMREIRPIGPARLVRPLLTWRREALREYAQRFGVEWIEDSSNADLTLDRNYLRHEVMPALARRWPGSAASLAQSASLAQQADQAIAGHAESALVSIGAQRGTIPVQWLQSQPASMQGGLLQEWARMLDFPSPGSRAIRKILHEVLEAGEDRMPEVQWGDTGAPVQVRRYRDRLYLLSVPPAHDASLRFKWDPDTSLVLPDGSKIMSRRRVGSGIAERFLLTGEVEIRFRQGGERCQPLGRSGSHPLKKVFQEMAIPPWQRDRIPLIYQENELIAVVGLFVCAAYAAGPDEAGREVTWELPSIEGG